MQLPCCLTHEPDGFVHVTDHRIGLEEIVLYHNEGYSAADLHHHFPTLPVSLIEEILGFYAENRESVDAYVAECRKAADRFYAETPKRITLAELRQRFAARQQDVKAP
jgi:uncharacterized protein (DUF433 family)